MDTMALLGILALLYAVTVIGITIKRPEKIWKMKKIQFFIKYLGEKGTVIFFYIWAFIFVGIGIWLLL